jgi:hypothetical protein
MTDFTVFIPDSYAARFAEQTQQAAWLDMYVADNRIVRWHFCDRNREVIMIDVPEGELVPALRWNNGPHYG